MCQIWKYRTRSSFSYLKVSFETSVCTTLNYLLIRSLVTARASWSLGSSQGREKQSGEGVRNFPGLRRGGVTVGKWFLWAEIKGCRRHCSRGLCFRAATFRRGRRMSVRVIHLFCALGIPLLWGFPSCECITICSAILLVNAGVISRFQLLWIKLIIIITSHRPTVSFGGQKHSFPLGLYLEVDSLGYRGDICLAF